MIKKANVNDLKIGVFVHDFNCDWQSENLYIEKTLIRNQHMLDILKTWGIKEVYIDTEKGLDVENSKSPRQVKKEAHKAITKIAMTGKGARQEVSLGQEIPSARKITNDAVNLLEKVHRQVKAGKTPEISETYELAGRMRDSIKRNRDALLLLTRIRNKDEYTLYHSISVSSLALNMCHYFQTPDHEALNLAVGALFHDIGKMIISEHILKKPQKLSAEEYREIQRHAEYSVRLLQKVDDLPLECYDIALHHHERFDGKGYPKGLSGNDISFGAQLTSICDVFDAITSERCYKSGVDMVTGLQMIYEGRDMLFNKELANHFIQCLGVYPVGSYVVLGDGRSGVVTSQTEDMLLPVVNLLFDEKKNQPLLPHKIDLSKTDNTIVSYGDPKKIGLTFQQVFKKLVAL